MTVQRKFVCGNVQEDTGLAVFSANVNVTTVRVVTLIEGMFGYFLHASLDDQEKVYVRPPPLLWRWGFTDKGALWRLKKAPYGLRSAPRLGSHWCQT